MTTMACRNSSRPAAWELPIVIQDKIFVAANILAPRPHLDHVVPTEPRHR